MLADRLELAGDAAAGWPSPPQASRYRVQGCVGDPKSCGVVLDTWFMLLLG
jgi:hypothetical protein